MKHKASKGKKLQWERKKVMNLIFTLWQRQSLERHYSNTKIK